MGTRLRKILISLCAAFSIILVISPAGSGADVYAEPVCTSGTNWDNGTQTCR